MASFKKILAVLFLAPASFLGAEAGVRGDSNLAAAEVVQTNPGGKGK